MSEKASEHKIRSLIHDILLLYDSDAETSWADLSKSLLTSVAPQEPPKQSGNTVAPIRPAAKPGRVKGSGPTVELDRALYDDMERLYRQNGGKHFGAARQLADRIPGASTELSRIRRLAKRFKRERSDWLNGRFRKSIK